MGPANGTPGHLCAFLAHVYSRSHFARDAHRNGPHGRHGREFDRSQAPGRTSSHMAARPPVLSRASHTTSICARKSSPSSRSRRRPPPTQFCRRPVLSACVRCRLCPPTPVPSPRPSTPISNPRDWRCWVARTLALMMASVSPHRPQTSFFSWGASGWNTASDALIVSCLNTRSHAVIAALEEALGKPVITSTQATLWHALRLATVRDPIAGYGRLLSHH